MDEYTHQDMEMPENMENGTFDVSKFRLNKLIEVVGHNKIPIDARDKVINKSSYHVIIKKILENEIQEALAIKNGVIKDSKEKIEFQQLANFVYEDGVRMLTLGGVFIKHKDLGFIDSKNFKDLDFIVRDDNSYEIDVPNLTLKEVSYLDSLIHKMVNFETWEILEGKDLNSSLSTSYFNANLVSSIPEQEIKKYAKLYKYYPTFLEALI